MSTNSNKKTPWFLWPFAALWNLLTWILSLTGRLIAAVLGLALMIVGVVLIITIVGAPLGIPLAIFGLLLMIRSIY
jgi:hypothetical protein